MFWMKWFLFGAKLLALNIGVIQAKWCFCSRSLRQIVVALQLFVMWSDGRWQSRQPRRYPMRPTKQIVQNWPNHLQSACHFWRENHSRPFLKIWQFHQEFPRNCGTIMYQDQSKRQVNPCYWAFDCPVERWPFCILLFCFLRHGVLPLQPCGAAATSSASQTRTHQYPAGCSDAWDCEPREVWQIIALLLTRRNEVEFDQQKPGWL